MILVYFNFILFLFITFSFFNSCFIFLFKLILNLLLLLEKSKKLLFEGDEKYKENNYENADYFYFESFRINKNNIESIIKKLNLNLKEEKFENLFKFLNNSIKSNSENFKLRLEIKKILNSFLDNLFMKMKKKKNLILMKIKKF